MTLDERVKFLEGLLDQLIKSDRYLFEKTVQLADGRNIQLGRSNGTKIGLSALEKLGFHGITPAAQYVLPVANVATSLVVTNDFGTTAFANGFFNEMEANMINAMYQTLIGHGLIRET